MPRRRVSRHPPGHPATAGAMTMIDYPALIDMLMSVASMLLITAVPTGAALGIDRYRD